MSRQKQNLLAAVSSTVCAALWLANLAVDLVWKLESPSQTLLHALCTVIWTACAVIWWAQWHRMRKAAQT